jgi:hypothetical protein
VEPGDKAYLARQISQGRVVLLTGAGFSLDARSVSGQQIPSVNTLRTRLAEIAFPGEALDDRSSLQDVYYVAASHAGTKTRDLLNALLRVDINGVPEHYRTWFSIPWYRHYTLNIDDLDEVVGRAYQLPRPIKPVSATSGTVVPYGNSMVSVHLNGMLNDYPNITFSARDFGQRTARPDEWYATLTADMLTRPVVIVGSSMDEPPLWQHIEIRRSRENRSREMRPASFLVSPDVPLAKAAMLRDFNIRWIKMTHEEFAREVLADFAAESEMGHRAISRELQKHVSSKPREVATLRTEPPPQDGALYLLGREPTWWDITDGFAIVREFEGRILEDFRVSKSRCLLITGTAGCGKSTTIKRLALMLDGEGETVWFVDSDENFSYRAIVSTVDEDQANWLVIDDISSLGRDAPRALLDILKQVTKTTIIAGVRSTRASEVIDYARAEDVDVQEVAVPLLVDSDIDMLIDTLDAANRLGRLAGQPRSAQRHAFREQAGRQLLVALIQATSGQMFEEKIASEFDELSSDEAFLYACGCIATHLRHYVTTEDLLIAHGNADNATIAKIRGLTRRGLFVEMDGRIKARHRLIASKVADYLQSSGRLSEPLRRLIFALGSRIRQGQRQRSREWRLFISLINHDFLQRVLDEQDVRRAYGDIESLVSWDYHYWLQRGSYEVEGGDIRQAEIFLEQARGLEPNDFRVRTEWAYLRLKRAALDPGKSESKAMADAALRELEDVIRGRGDADFYPFHVYGSQGLRWARRAPISNSDRIVLLRRLRSVVDDGIAKHRYNRDLAQLRDDLEQEYLRLAVPLGRRGADAS